MKNALFAFSISLFAFTSTNVYAQLDTARLATEIRNLFSTSDLPGLSAAIVTADGPVFQISVGYADRDTEKRFLPTSSMPVGSVTKTLTGMAIVKLIESGALDWDAPINDYLPFSIVNPYFPEEPIQVRHLLNHTSSLLDGKNYGQTYLLDGRAGELDKEGMHWGYLDFLEKHERISLRGFVEQTLVRKGKWYKKKNFLKSKPGTEKAYSNINAAVAGLLVEQVSGKPYATYVQEEIFEPLKMTTSSFAGHIDYNSSRAQLYFPSGYRVPPFELATYPDGGWLTSVSDLSLYLQDVLGGYQGRPGLLSEESYQLMLPGDEDEKRAFWGMGSESRLIGHTGSDPGVHCDIRFSADHPVGVVLLTNTNAEDNEELWQQFKGIMDTLSEAASKVNLKRG
ncbi:MAG: serine hydrolase domain-containing protein [Bacteroidota bacterium]